MDINDIIKTLTRLPESETLIVIGYSREHAEALVQHAQLGRTDVHFLIEPGTIITGTGPMQGQAIRAVPFDISRTMARVEIKAMRVGTMRTFPLLDDQHLYSIHNAIKYLHRQQEGHYSTKRIGDKHIQVTREG